jgi:hypothetical protein
MAYFEPCADALRRPDYPSSLPISEQFRSIFSEPQGGLDLRLAHLIRPLDQISRDGLREGRQTKGQSRRAQRTSRARRAKIERGPSCALPVEIAIAPETRRGSLRQLQ